MADRFLYKTKSVCPVCLKEVYADIVSRDSGIYMDKSCAQHGSFSTLIWADSAENYLRWLEYGGIDIPRPRRNVESSEEFGAYRRRLMRLFEGEDTEVAEL